MKNTKELNLYLQILRIDFLFILLQVVDVEAQESRHHGRSLYLLA